MFSKFNRMPFIVGLGTVVGVVLLLLVYRLALGPKSAEVAFPTLSSITTVANPENAQCVKCHQEKSPGVVDEYHDSKHAQKGVQCLDCHKPLQGQDKLTETHYNIVIVANPTPNNCAQCHKQEVEQEAASRHGARAWYPIVGAAGFDHAQMAQYGMLDAAGNPLNGGQPNAIKGLIGADASALSCEVCHGIGKTNADGSSGDCTKCHLRHDFSVSQARQPETCAQCHLGPDHPQAEIYNESAHGAYYQANKDKFNLDAPPGTLTTKDFPAPTCATCHISAFGDVKGTHDVGQRLSWNLAPQIAAPRPTAQQNRQTMEQVCVNCHSQDFVDKQMAAADKVINLSNQNVQKGQNIVDDLKKAGLLPGPPMSTPIDYLNFELWHHEGRRARSGAVMGGADYVNWHGIYDQNKALAEMQADANELKKQH